MATGDACHCVCGGANHGIGLDAAIKNVKEHGDEMAKEFETENPGSEVEIKIDE
jgi:hypothetical protein